MQDEPYRRCRKCGEDKPLTEFHRDPRGAAGRTQRCKVCIYARQRQQRAERRAARPPREFTIEWTDPGAEFGHWLAGFADGEGCFYISSTRREDYKITSRSYRTHFMLRLRDDDRAILDEIATRTGIGRVYRIRRRGGQNSAASWEVNSIADCAALTAIFDRYPLHSKKARDYVLWRKAVLYRASRERGNRWHRLDWGPMAALKHRLERGRAYRPGSA